ncbi:very short patch repair endonuclease [Ruegeria sp. YS9]|uniref:very short patch repair endonuclease n=1 Tax=Ruegeria sp. YS9 TaxID=2966453 RepID=UPI00214B5055|nr:very short patch repair endonuclease [Ruegeria sp. YS9]UUV06539.1 very short patch repair endonuclease [Ruegeria sp. YS9]
MADTVDRKTRSRMMSRIRGTNTRPETLLRKALHAQGFRFRLNVRRLPGSPDIVLPKWRTAIFVHGCFWHRHTGCPKAATPKSNVAFWHEKFAANMRRDAEAIQQLHDLGWRTLVVWECTVESDVDGQLTRALADFIRWSGEHHGEF